MNNSKNISEDMMIGSHRNNENDRINEKKE